jgi:hypothetical protein
MQRFTVTRRGFLARAASAGAGLVILRRSASAWGYAANAKLNVALIGVGGRGTWFVDTIPRLENVVALCDVNQQKITEAFQYWEQTGKRWAASPNVWEVDAAKEFRRLGASKPGVFSDFRRMLDELKSLDAVVVATPDHTHAVASAAAMHAGKGVFCEKPLTRLLHESRALCELARKQRVATAMGNQGTYSGAFRRALELIRSGAIGEIKEVHVWNSGGGADRKEPPKGPAAVPDYLMWDLWLGPARERPYHKEWLQRNDWRDFGTCQLGNWGSHSANLGFMALKVHELWSAAPPKEPEGDSPIFGLSGGTGGRNSGQSPRPVIRIEAQTSGINRLSFPRWELVRWQIPARGGLPPITIKWYSGDAPGVKEVVESVAKDAPPHEKNNWRFAGTLIAGTQGSIHTTGHNMMFRLLPESRFQGVQRERPESVAASRGPEVDFFAACRGGPPGWSNFDYAHALNEFLMLGNVATQFEGPLDFEPVAMKIVNHPAADAALRCEYRQGWSL